MMAGLPAVSVTVNGGFLSDPSIIVCGTYIKHVYALHKIGHL